MGAACSSSSKAQDVEDPTYSLPEPGSPDKSQWPASPEKLPLEVTTVNDETAPTTVADESEDKVTPLMNGFGQQVVAAVKSVIEAMTPRDTA